MITSFDEEMHALPYACTNDHMTSETPGTNMYAVVIYPVYRYNTGPVHDLTSAYYHANVCKLALDTHFRA